MMTNWVNEYGFLISERKQIIQDAPIMTEYERVSAERAYMAKKERLYPEIVQGAREMMSAAISKYKSAQASGASAKKYELARWDSARLSNEMRVTEQLVSAALKVGSNPFTGETPVKALEQIYREAMASGDIHEMRGCCEVMRAALAGVSASGAPQEVRLAANRLAQEAERQLEELRETPGMKAAALELSEATVALLEVREQVCEISKTLDGIRADEALNSNAFSFIVRQVGTGRAGGIVIYDERSPEVTGVESGVMG